MEPTIMSGSYAVTLSSDKYNINDLLVLRINDGCYIVKRITAQIDEKYQINSDNQNTSSSLCDYTYSRNAIIGKVVFKFNLICKLSRFVKDIKYLLKYDKKYADGNN